MTPYIGSHDTPRFVSLADYRGQTDHPVDVPSHQWTDTAVEPSEAEPYRRMRIALAWLLTLPGAPLLYYGDEYGQWGGADPNNRLMWRDEGSLDADELATLELTRELGAARQRLEALRRGSYVTLGATTEDTLSFGRRVTNGPVAIVALTRSLSAEPVTVNVTSLGLASGTVLHDELGGPDVTVAGESVSFTVPASGAVILSP
jgi:glycosidase